MKKILLLNILFLISSMAYGYTMYSTSSYLHSRNTNVAYTQTYNTYNNTCTYKAPRIGYSTINYGNTYNPEKNLNYNGSEYTPTSGRPGMRKIKVYDENGSTDNAPGNGEGIYVKGEDGKWYYSNDNGATWYIWRGPESFWEYIGAIITWNWEKNWKTYGTAPPENGSKWASNPNDPFLDPIGDIPPHLLLLLTGGYGLYKYKKRDLRRHQKQKQS